ncbi:unnamed protein product [Ambrosiozyma monospora]|uniref:Unnamed protein product n=1 Tax=Ambrosiozyma monospora TaxID=43982 RepID=A0ACB5SZV3_AMBMO|nr:unnamed protein product [Ambrosiozyma monospora]
MAENGDADNDDEANSSSSANATDTVDEEDNTAPEEHILPDEATEKGRMPVATLLRKVMYCNFRVALVSVKHLIETITSIEPGKHSKSDKISVKKCLETLIKYFLNHDQWCLRFRKDKALTRPSSQSIEVFHNLIKHPSNGMGGRTTLTVFLWFCTLRKIMKKFSWDWETDHRYKTTNRIRFRKFIYQCNNINQPTKWFWNYNSN